ncbi:c-Jun NH2-terminal kinase-like protein [Dinothrombium tinctorium]|uniref:Stress-activated protein kinase JNK n=1 Tax=Dinothrombium tinctorium TaxID=1965070 RepID=A0A443RN00_9ACAR|nr:c-Jun NH2-terminal kinase-like protein [Dinothrombium tinctorium]
MAKANLPALEKREHRDENSTFISFHLCENKLTVPKRYQDLKQIGIGAQGIVFSAYDTIKKSHVAIKKLKHPFKNIASAKRTYRELKLMRLANHENVISLLNVFTPNKTLKEFNEIYLVMELMDSTLEKIIRIKLARVDQERISYMVYQILCGVKHLHSAGIIHRDLKPSNIGVKQDFTLKILDFGFARKTDIYMTQSVVTRHYRAPEVILGMSYNEKVDIWSIGCIFGEMIRNEVLFPGKNLVDQWNKIVDRLGPPPLSFLHKDFNIDQRDNTRNDNEFTKEMLEKLFPDILFPEKSKMYSQINSVEARDLLSRMLKYNSDERISIDEALCHPYINVWCKENKVNAISTHSYDHSIEEKEYKIEDWITLIYKEVVDFLPQ